MATQQGALVPDFPIVQAGRLEPHTGAVVVFGEPGTVVTTYYKLGAIDSGTGLFVYWIGNTTTDTTNRPAPVGSYGATVVMASWTVLSP